LRFVVGGGGGGGGGAILHFVRLFQIYAEIWGDSCDLDVNVGDNNLRFVTKKVHINTGPILKCHRFTIP